MRVLYLSLLLAVATGCGPKLTDTMTLSELEQAVIANPPRWTNAAERSHIFKSMDKLITVRVSNDMTDHDRAALTPLIAYYRRRVDAGLDRIEKTVVTEGALVVKLYSSSILLKSADGVVAMDICQGPIPNGKPPEAADFRKCGFYMTPEQRDRLASLVDVSVMTHRHHDHSDFSLSRRLADANKIFIGPAQLRTHWKALADKLTVPEYGTAQKFGPVEMQTFFGYQYAANETGPDGKRRGVPHKIAKRNNESIVFLLRVGGVTFFQAAENHVPCTDWFKKALADGWKPNVVFSQGQWQGAESVRPHFGPHLSIPIHEYEMTHGGGGNRTGNWLNDRGQKAVEAKRKMALTWGEGFHITPDVLNFSY